MRLIDADALYEKTAEWEAQALHMVEVTMNDDDKTEWKKWSTVLNERSAFKFDIADAPVIETKQQWIPCSERLPNPERRTYWVCTDEEYQCACRWTNNRFGIGESETWGWSIMDIPQYCKVVAWMPLPKPYKENGHETD